MSAAHRCISQPSGGHPYNWGASLALPSSSVLAISGAAGSSSSLLMSALLVYRFFSVWCVRQWLNHGQAFCHVHSSKAPLAAPMCIVVGRQLLRVSISAAAMCGRLRDRSGECKKKISKQVVQSLLVPLYPAMLLAAHACVWSVRQVDAAPEYFHSVSVPSNQQQQV